MAAVRRDTNLGKFGVALAADKKAYEYKGGVPAGGGDLDRLVLAIKDNSTTDLVSRIGASFAIDVRRARDQIKARTKPEEYLRDYLKEKEERSIETMERIG